MAKRGPKTMPIDWEAIGKLAHIQCTQEEIAHFCGCDVRTLDVRCPKETGLKLSEYIKKHAQGGKMSLRRWQWRVAENEAQGRGKCTMLIFLGKQYLGQSDQGPQNKNGDLGNSDPDQVEQLTKWLEELDSV